MIYSLYNVLSGTLNPAILYYARPILYILVDSYSANAPCALMWSHCTSYTATIISFCLNQQGSSGSFEWWRLWHEGELMDAAVQCNERTMPHSSSEQPRHCTLYTLLLGVQRTKKCSIKARARMHGVLNSRRPSQRKHITPVNCLFVGCRLLTDGLSILHPSVADLNCRLAFATLCRRVTIAVTVL